MGSLQTASPGCGGSAAPGSAAGEVPGAPAGAWHCWFVLGETEARNCPGTAAEQGLLPRCGCGPHVSKAVPMREATSAIFIPPPAVGTGHYPSRSVFPSFASVLTESFTARTGLPFSLGLIGDVFLRFNTAGVEKKKENRIKREKFDRSVVQRNGTREVNKS